MENKIDARVTFLPQSSGEGARLEVYDAKSATTFLTVEFDAEQFCQLMGRLSHTHAASAVVRGLERVGKIHEVAGLTVEIPGDTGYDKRAEVARAAILKACPDGWTPDLYFDRTGSFSPRSGQTTLVRTFVHRWVDDDSEETTEE